MVEKIISYWPVYFILILIYALGGLITALNWWKSRNRRYPFSSELFRLPGQSQGNVVDDLKTELTLLLFVIPLATLIVTLAINNEASTRGPVFYWLYLITFTGGMCYLIIKILRIVYKLQNHRLGMWGEMATGQLLDTMMLDGHRVFHDFQAGAFNIDHVVVTDRAVLAVETKARRKPMGRAGGDEFKVRFDGRMLHFPDWKDAKSVEQARRQARWLADWLEKSTGDRVPVVAVLALPGWYIERTGRSETLAVNPKNARQLARGLKQPPLPPDLHRRILFQLEKASRHSPWSPDVPHPTAKQVP